MIGGERLVKMIGEVQRNPETQVARKQPAKICPECGSEMVVRVARKGKYAGQKFWGCSQFPECRTIVKYVANECGAGLQEDSAVDSAANLKEV